MAGRSKAAKMSIVSGVISNVDQMIGGKESFEIFQMQQVVLDDKIRRNRSGLVSIVTFTLKLLRHCLRYINYKELKPVFDFKSKTKEKELFRYLHLIVDLSSNSSNHPVVMHPIFIRNVLVFVLQSESENLMHYHRIFDCRFILLRSDKHDSEGLFFGIFLDELRDQMFEPSQNDEARSLRSVLSHNLPALRSISTDCS